jgi:hypothetical protein
MPCGIYPLLVTEGDRFKRVERFPPAPRSALGATYSVSTNRLSIFAGENTPFCCNLLNDVWVLPDASGIFSIVSLSQTDLAFKTQLVGTTSKPQSVTLTNTGDATLTISSIAASGDFVQRNDCGSSVPAGESCTINVTFTPGARGQRQASLKGSADDKPIQQLFRDFLRALRIREGKKKDQTSPVAVAKALHLLSPDFFPLWDQKIALTYKCGYSRDLEAKYLCFVRKAKEIAEKLQTSVDPKAMGKTLLKLVDEFNYAKYTQGWI